MVRWPVQGGVAWERCDVEFLRGHTTKPIKITVPGPFTMSQQAQDDFYKDEVALAMDYAAAVNVEIEDLFVAGADIVQVDEPYMRARPEKAKRFGVQVLDRALEGVGGITAVGLVWPSGWVWHGGEGKYYLQMICGIYAVLGIFLLLASRDPSQYRSVISFTVWSSVVHAIIMAVQAIGDRHEIGHLIGDVPALLIVAVVFWYLAPVPKSAAG